MAIEAQGKSKCKSQGPLNFEVLRQKPWAHHHPILVGQDKSTCMMLAAERGSEELLSSVGG